MTSSTNGTPRGSAALVLLVVGVTLFAGGLALGLMKVTAGESADCGTGFSKQYSDELTQSGTDTCEREHADRNALAVAFLVMGGVAAAGAGAIQMTTYRASMRAEMAAAGEIPPPGPDPAP